MLALLAVGPGTTAAARMRPAHEEALQASCTWGNGKVVDLRAGTGCAEAKKVLDWWFAGKPRPAGWNCDGIDKPVCKKGAKRFRWTY